MTCGTFIEPLDLECLFINTFAETVSIFIGIAFLFFASLAAYFRMPNTIFFGLMIILLVILSAFVDVSLMLTTFILVGGTILFMVIRKTVTSN